MKMAHDCHCCITAYSVTIGLQQTAYTVTEDDEQQLVCFEVLSGDVNGREFVIDYTTSSGTASKLMKGMLIADILLRLLCIIVMLFIP